MTDTIIRGWNDNVFFSDSHPISSMAGKVNLNLEQLSVAEIIMCHFGSFYDTSGVNQTENRKHIF